MKFKANPKIFEKFQGLTVGAAIAKGLDNRSDAQEIQAQLREEEKRIRATYVSETLSQEPKIDCWRKAYSAFGGKPKENRSSVENLYKSVLRGNEQRHINKLVDAYNLVSLRHMLPVGGEDLDKMQGDLALTFAGEDEAPVLLLGERDARPPHPGEVIYKDGVSTVCRRWNWREADRTKLTEETRNAILVIEGLPPVTKEEVEDATKELIALVQKSCGGKLVPAILDADKPEIGF